MSPTDRREFNQQQHKRIMSDPILLERQRAGDRKTGMNRAEWKNFVASQKAERVASKFRAREQRLAEVAAHRLASKDARRERQRAQQKAWRTANSERHRELINAWRRANPEKRRIERQGRKTRKRKTLVRDLLAKQRGRCAYCRTKLDPSVLQIDHIEPLARGGADDRRNLQATCPACNRAKHAKDPIDFARQTGRLI